MLCSCLSSWRIAPGNDKAYPYVKYHCVVWATPVAVKSIDPVKMHGFLRLMEAFHSGHFLLTTNTPNAESTLKQILPYVTSTLPTNQILKKRETQISVFSSFFKTQTRAHDIISTNKTYYSGLQIENDDLLAGGIPNSPPGGMAAAGVVFPSPHPCSPSPGVRPQRQGQPSISGVWSTSNSICAPTGGRSALWDPFCVTWSFLLGSRIFKPTCSQHAQGVFSKTPSF